MDIGIIGSGTVAQTLAGKLLELGHSVMISSRDTTQAKDRGDWGALPSADDFAAAQRELGREAAAGSFADAAAHGELVINATAGGHSLAALEAAGADNLAGKILVDVANPLDFSQGMPPTLLFCNTDSLGERIQAAFPEARVVKSLNTMTAQVMVDPRSSPSRRRSSSPATTRRPRTGSTTNCSSAGSAGSRCSTSATSPPPAAWRCGCPCGCG